MSDACPTCGADRTTVERDGHYWLDEGGRVAFADTPDQRPCPEEGRGELGRFELFGPGEWEAP